jgi:sialic acid synthase SpsE
MKTYITAEIGCNASGNFSVAMSLIHAARDAGADAVKFQMWHPTRFTDIAHLRMSEDDLLATMDEAKDNGLDWYCTPFDLYSIGWLANIGMKQWKVPSGMITNQRFLNAIKDVNPCRIHLSTGGSSRDDVISAIMVLDDFDIITYQCVTCYPAPLSDLNLAVVRHWWKWYGDVGYSDHSGNCRIPALAVAAGATFIECHITLDRNQEGPDHKASLDPSGFAEMVKRVREVEVIMGDGEKKPAPCEVGKIEAIRKRMEL